MTASTTGAKADTRPAPPDRSSAGRAPRNWKVIAAYAALILVAVVYIYPFLIQIATSFKTDADVTAHPLALWPTEFTTAAFRRLTEVNYSRWFTNSVVVAVFVTTGRVFFDSLAGYALARLKFRGRSLVFASVIGIMAVPGVVLLIPRFLVLNSLGLYDSYTGMILPLMVDAAGVFIMKQFFESIPVSIEEAARIDGAGTFRIFWSVVLPMAKPALITLTILSFQGSWNELAYFIVARQNPDLNTLTTGVGSLVSGQLGSGSQYPLKLAAALLMTIPVALVYFAFQRQFIRGAGEGAVKG
jgi:multiple sugar transport system permease protein